MRRIVAIFIAVSISILANAKARTEVADSLSEWKIPSDAKSSEPYNPHFKPGEVLPGNSTLVHPDFAGNQNLWGTRRTSHIGGKLFEEEFTVYFRRNRTELDPSYLWNPGQLCWLDSFLGSSHVLVDTVTVFAYASPEGHYGHNVWLSRQRALTVRNYLTGGGNSSLDPGKVLISQQEENWPGLRFAVRTIYNRTDKGQVLEILTREGLSDSARKRMLRDIDRGVTYNYLIDTLMPPLRSAIVKVRWAESAPLELIRPLECALPLAVKPSPVTLNPRQRQELWAKRTILALKTNCLYDAVTALNYAVEVPFGEDFSVAWEHYFPWWSTKDELKYCLQYLTLGGEMRWWFAPRTRPETAQSELRDALVGHFIGVYGLWGKMDLQWQRSLGMYQCYPVVSTGITYGYSMPVSRRWNLELSASAGYARVPYQHYIPSRDWKVLWRDREKVGILHYFGPTKLSVTLVRPILIKYRVR